VLIDVLNQVTGTSEEYFSIIPEPYTYRPEEQRAVAMADASITSTFLEKFARSTRDAGLESDLSNRATAAQRLHMLNSSHMLRKLELAPKLRVLLGSNARKPEAVRELYLTMLSRLPTDEELQTIQVEAERGLRRRDLAWVLVNSVEFNYRH
jgi:hypothetical protein